MTMVLTRSNKKDVPVLKKRKIEVNGTLNNELLNNGKSYEKVDEVRKQINKENEGISTENVTIRKISKKQIGTDKNNDLKVETNDTDLDLVTNTKNIINCSNDIEVTNRSQNSVISIRKIEELCMTPKKNNTSRDLENTSNIKVENINSPQTFSTNNLGINSMKWLSTNIEGTPTTDDNQTQSICNESTPNRKTKRKFSGDIGDYDQLSDAIKSELCNNEINDMEVIDMLHDLNSVMDFEESKMLTNLFCSTANDIVLNEESINEEHKELEVDPLFIADNDNSNTVSEKVESQEIKYDPNMQQEECSNNTENVKNKSKRNKKPKSNEEDSDVDYDVIKHVLGELDIELSSEEEELNESFTDETNELSEHELKRLYNLNVQLVHEVPKQHNVEHTAGSKTLTKIEKKLFLKHGPLKCGPFTPNEDKTIMDNWKAFCKVHDWDPECVTPFLKMKYGNKFYIKSMQERKKFSQFLANGLPWRTLYSVYHRFRYLHENHEKSFQRYKSNEDEKILRYIKNIKEKKRKQKKFVELGKMLGRSRHSIWLRYKLLNDSKKSETSLSEVKWTLCSIGKFLKTFMDVTLCETVEDLKDAIIPKPVWQKLEQKLNINYNTLRTFWLHQLHMQLFCPEPIYLNDIKVKLIEYVYGKGIADTREIVWSNVVKYFDGVTSIFLCKTFFYLVQEAAIKVGTKYFPVLIEYLYNEKIEDIKEDLSDKFLPRLSYNNGEVKIIDDDLNED